MKALVLGVGNVLLGDEGVGVRVAEELNARYRDSEEVEILDGGTAGIELLRYLEGRDILIIIDAMAGGHPPGSVYLVEGDDVPKRFMEKISPHQIGLSDLLAAAIISDTLPPRIIMYAVEPKNLATGIGLTPEVEEAAGRVVSLVAAHLDSVGLAHETSAQVCKTADSHFYAPT